ncbi:hypothetical protein ACFYNO_39790 [Kitasatospora sp. NPDC006697]
MADSCWERNTQQTGTILYLVEEVTYRDILPGEGFGAVAGCPL